MGILVVAANKTSLVLSLKVEDITRQDCIYI
jgi:hypothetical protein